MKKPIFNNPRVTRLMKRYAKHPKDLELRNRILLLSTPLIEAALSKQRMFEKRFREDIRQECVVKVLQALPKFDGNRGDAFGFLWATICNMSKSVNERLHRPSYSLSTDESVQREAEKNSKNVFQTPENQRILSSIAKELNVALVSTVSGGKLLRIKAKRYLQNAVSSGDLFTNKVSVVRGLKKMGLDKREVQFHVQRSQVLVREKLLKAREDATAISHYNGIDAREFFLD